MSHRIPSVTSSAPAQPVAMPPRGRAGTWIALATMASAAVAKRVDSEAPASSPAPRSAAEPVRPGAFGRDGRFEKFILALQALHLDLGGVDTRTDRVEHMRAAAEELFGIDGLPQPVRPLAGPGAASVPAAGPKADPESLAPDTAPAALTDASDAKPGIASAEATCATDRPAASVEPAVPAALAADILLPGDSPPER